MKTNKWKDRHDELHRVRKADTMPNTPKHTSPRGSDGVIDDAIILIDSIAANFAEENQIQAKPNNVSDSHLQKKVPTTSCLNIIEKEMSAVEKVNTISMNALDDGCHKQGSCHTGLNSNPKLTSNIFVDKPEMSSQNEEYTQEARVCDEHRGKVEPKTHTDDWSSGCDLATSATEESYDSYLSSLSGNSAFDASATTKSSVSDETFGSLFNDSYLTETRQGTDVLESVILSLFQCAGMCSGTTFGWKRFKNDSLVNRGKL